MTTTLHVLLFSLIAISVALGIHAFVLIRRVSGLLASVDDKVVKARPRHTADQMILDLESDIEEAKDANREWKNEVWATLLAGTTRESTSPIEGTQGITDPTSGQVPLAGENQPVANVIPILGRQQAR